MIGGVHAIVFADDAERARAFFRDVLELKSVDAGDGWLIFGLPPAELACHPGPGWGLEVGHHVLFLMCHDGTRRSPSSRARARVRRADQRRGLRAGHPLQGPRSRRLGLYEPRHPSPLDEFADG